MVDYSDRITVDPEIMIGKPTIKGTRITVEVLLRKLSQEISPENILEEYPRLEKEDLQAALQYAADSVSTEELHISTGQT